MSGSLKFEHMKIFPLVVDKIIHQLNEHCNLFGGRAKDGIFAEVDFIFINFETVRSGYNNKGMFGRKYWLGIFLLLDHVKSRLLIINYKY